MDDRSNPMQVIFDLSAVNSDQPQMDLRLMCGSRYNAFVPAGGQRETPGKFFERETWKAITNRRGTDEENERWDGME
jgi:hypothetical protein